MIRRQHALRSAVDAGELSSEDAARSLVDYAYAIATKYGEGAASAACEMYDAVAILQNAKVPAAVPAETATYGETAKTVYGTLKTDPDTVPSAVGRLVKQAGVDTTMHNAIRDGAEWAWIPSGDSCNFCLMLASQGWVKASNKVLEGGHASHIHNHCDCTFAIRFDGKSTVEGYDPDALRKIYDNAEGTTWKEKLRYLDRQSYAANRKTVRARKRTEYAARMERQRGDKTASTVVDMKQIGSQSYRMQFRGITDNDKVDDRICEHARTILEHRSGTRKEDLVLLDAETGKQIHLHDRSDKDGGVKYDDLINDAIQEAHEKGQKIIAIHNHPNGLPPTADDGASAFNHEYDFGVVAGHDGSVYTYTPSRVALTEKECDAIHRDIALQIKTGADRDGVWYTILKEYGISIRRR